MYINYNSRNVYNYTVQCTNIFTRVGEFPERIGKKARVHEVQRMPIGYSIRHITYFKLLADKIVKHLQLCCAKSEEGFFTS